MCAATVGGLINLSIYCRSSRFERLEQGYPNFYVVYFSRGTLPPKKEMVNGHYWGT